VTVWSEYGAGVDALRRTVHGLGVGCVRSDLLKGVEHLRGVHEKLEGDFIRFLAQAMVPG
jgi:hypothetical protein